MFIPTFALNPSRVSYVTMPVPMCSLGPIILVTESPLFYSTRFRAESYCSCIAEEVDKLTPLSCLISTPATLVCH